ncbi:switch-associated protein 70-like [Clytia hemisphaerica]|uniref:PH domain-containing protein n=1 Tax=Clytia hemisphaerica TaxID=252671 RepID=A0A7M5VB71_9CNID
MADENITTTSSDEIDETDSPDAENWDISLRHGTLSKELKALEYFTANGLRQAFNVLDPKSTGKVTKTQLQILCINLCNVINVQFSPEDIMKFKDGEKELQFQDFIAYIGSKLLRKMDEKVVDSTKLDEISWTIVEKQRKTLTGDKKLTDNELFMIWQAFNKINIDNTVNIDIEETALFLEEFMTAMGTPWTRGPLDDFANGKIKLTFWEFIDCLENKYILSTPKSVYKFGLDKVNDVYVKEIMKTGLLTKKGHKVKSMKERFFVLSPQLLTYYEGKSSNGKRKGVIFVAKQSKVEGIDDSKTSKCRFSILCAQKNVPYEMEACDPKTKNEWIAKVQRCIDCGNLTPLMRELKDRSLERMKRRKKIADEERSRLEQEELIRRQLEELELIRLARDEAQAQAENEAALKEEERTRREELELLKAEYEKLLQEEKQAREVENQVREKQQQILEEEMLKRQELEKIKNEQDRILEEERKAREGLEELSKEQKKALDDERERLSQLEKARKRAEEQVETFHLKMKEAEEERRQAALKVELAKEKTRQMKVPVGLAKPLTLEQKMLITHRGAGSFVEQDFSKRPLYQQTDQPAAEIVNQRKLDEGERTEIVESNLVKPSEGSKHFEVI